MSKSVSELYKVAVCSISKYMRGKNERKTRKKKKLLITYFSMVTLSLTFDTS